MTGCSTHFRFSRAAVAHHLRVEWRLAIGEGDGEAELVREEIAGRPDIGYEEVRLGGGDDGCGGSSVCMVRHGRQPVLSACQLSKPCCRATSSCASLRRNTVREDVRIGHLAEAGQARPDLGRDRIVAVTMPAQDELGLFAKVFDIRHRRSYG
jgi:hypothetical protein